MLISPRPDAAAFCQENDESSFTWSRQLPGHQLLQLPPGNKTADLSFTALQVCESYWYRVMFVWISAIQELSIPVLISILVWSGSNCFPRQYQSSDISHGYPLYLYPEVTPVACCGVSNGAKHWSLSSGLFTFCQYCYHKSLPVYFYTRAFSLNRF